MQSCKNYLLPVLALAVLTPQVWAQPDKKEEKKVTIRRLDKDSPRRVEANVEKETITFLGVETANVGRTLGAQLGLPRETGLIITRVAEDSPAASVLKEDDVLTKFEDQILVNMPQLGTLVRSKNAGDEVKLTVVRGGKETVLKTKLASREVPKLAQAEFFQGFPSNAFSFEGNNLQGIEQLRNFPGMGPDHARDVLRIIGRERANALNGPRVHIRSRAGQGATIVDLPKSNISYSDDDGSIEIKSEDDKRTLTVKDAKGTVQFNGPLNTDEDRKKLPPEIAARLEKIDVETINFEAGEDFKAEFVPAPPAPAKSKINRDVTGEPAFQAKPAGRPL
ncbi:PDZ domain-containing protein [Oleiharenicola lentus]|uniref:PDZ domain-containing protein n=1 Tax=Oleiharenicola lentus TaxID=2508720 RepID=UPI003F66148E